MNGPSGPLAARVVLMLGAAAIVVGSFGPWLHHASGADRHAIYGVDGFGMYVALGAMLIVVFGLVRMYGGSVIVAALVSAVGVITYLDAKDRTESVGADYFGGSIGWGLFVIVGGGVVAFVAGGVCARRARSRRAASGSGQSETV